MNVFEFNSAVLDALGPAAEPDAGYGVASFRVRGTGLYVAATLTFVHPTYNEQRRRVLRWEAPVVEFNVAMCEAFRLDPDQVASYLFEADGDGFRLNVEVVAEPSDVAFPTMPPDPDVNDY